jgi:hypothetical protein
VLAETSKIYSEGKARSALTFTAVQVVKYRDAVAGVELRVA